MYVHKSNIKMYCHLNTMQQLNHRLIRHLNNKHKHNTFLWIAQSGNKSNYDE